MLDILISMDTKIKNINSSKTMFKNVKKRKVINNGKNELEKIYVKNEYLPTDIISIIQLIKSAKKIYNIDYLNNINIICEYENESKVFSSRIDLISELENFKIVAILKAYNYSLYNRSSISIDWNICDRTTIVDKYFKETNYSKTMDSLLQTEYEEKIEDILQNKTYELFILTTKLCIEYICLELLKKG